MILLLSIAGLVLAATAALMFCANLPLFRFSHLPIDPDDSPSVSVLIPARDEAAGIAASVGAALASQNVDVEVVVLDDHSSDQTAQIVQEIAQSDPRVRYQLGRELPEGWNGKQFACWQLSQAASHPRLVFLDADVRLQPHALSQLIARQEATGVALLSAFPHQETETWLEKLLIPMMHNILLGYLPLSRMRGSTSPAYAAGCGQLFMTNSSDYETAGTHEAIKGSRHDGIKLPRAYRLASLSTDVVDGTDLAECRMYHNAGQVIRGVLKNAHEGIANPKLIVVFTVLLIGAAVLPLLTLITALILGQTLPATLAACGVVLGHLPRALAAKQFRQSSLGIACHSVAVLVFVALQWIALVSHLSGTTVAWRGRR